MDASQVLKEVWHVEFDQLGYLKVLEMQLWHSGQEQRLHLFINEQEHEYNESLLLTLRDRDQHTGNEIHTLAVAHIRHTVGNC